MSDVLHKATDAYFAALEAGDPTASEMHKAAMKTERDRINAENQLAATRTRIEETKTALADLEEEEQRLIPLAGERRRRARKP